MTNLIHKVYRNLSKQYHPDKNPKDKTLHHKLSTFDQLLNNLPFINSKEYQITKSVKNKMISLNESFIKSDVTKQNEILKNLINNITTNDTKNVINTYANYNNKCEAYTIKDDDLKKDDLSFTLKEFEDISTLFLQEIQTDKDEYSKLFNNYKTLYQKCFKSPIEIEADKAEAARVAKEAADKAEAARVAKEEVITAIKDEILKKNLPINENNIDVLKNGDFDTLTTQYSKKSVEDAVTTIIAHTQDFQQEHLPNLIKSHEIFSDSNTYTAEELDQAESCIMDGEC